MVELAGRLIRLLAQKMEGGEDFAAGVIGIKFDIVPNRIGWEKTINRACG